MPRANGFTIFPTCTCPRSSWTPCWPSAATTFRWRLRLGRLRRAEAQRQAVPPVSAKNADAGKEVLLLATTGGRMLPVRRWPASAAGTFPRGRSRGKACLPVRVAAFTANRLPGIESEAERLGFATLRSAGCSLLPMAACLETAAPQCQNLLSGAGYVPDAPGLRAFCTRRSRPPTCRSPAAACARFYWRSIGGICCWPPCRANPLPVRRSPPIAVPPARWTCKKIL